MKGNWNKEKVGEIENEGMVELGNERTRKREEKNRKIKERGNIGGKTN